jgi:TonB-dependent receptor
MQARYKSLAAMLFLAASHVLGQGIVRGVVSDSTAKEILIGANVHLLGTALGASTDREGKYRISGIAAGVYTVRFTYIGYKTKEISVRVADGENILNARLLADMIEGEEVVVTAQRRGQHAAINQQITSNTIMNVISEEKIKELPDANAAEAIGRLPGVSLIRTGGEASKVILRGMSDKFTSFTIDGIRIPPTDANERGVDLSTFSQGTLAGVELFKALTPDKDADAIAGSVNLVTRKAPSTRQVRFDAKEVYNDLSNEGILYEFNGKYGERFFDDVLGVQATGNIERRDRSDERFNLAIENLSVLNQTGWLYDDFTLSYTDEIRKRGGGELLLDINTPDSGTIRINNLYSRTNRNFIVFTRDYPVGGDNVFYSASDREIEINSLSSSVRGENYLLDLDVHWGASYAQSKSETPYDYRMVFGEPSIVDSSGMRPVPRSLLNGPPELFIPYAYNNFRKTQLDTAYFRSTKSADREKAVFADVAKHYAIGDVFAGEVKAGGKYRYKNRFHETGETFAPYYLNYFQTHTRNPDGSITPKNFAGTRFANLATVGRLVLFSNFLDANPKRRNLYDLYNLNPLVNRDALREWYELNKNGIGTNGQSEYNVNPEATADYYDIVERVTAGYVMNTLNFGTLATLIAGVRVESENNDYLARYASQPLGGFPTTGTLLDTTATFKETIWLPNFHLTVRPTDFMNVRLAAYRAIARPDFNSRLLKLVARVTNPRNTLVYGNPSLRNAKAWNFEVGTSFYGNTIGLFTVSAFYRDIADMFHSVSGIPGWYKPSDPLQLSLLDSLGIRWNPSFPANNPISVSYTVNSARPTKVWGFEIEHQANLSFLPGLLSNIVLSYNLSVVRSETFILTSTRDTVYRYVVIIPPDSIRVPIIRNPIYEAKGKLEGQPDLFGNIAIGYDIGGFSGRLSVFHQGEYARSYSATRESNPTVQKFSRWDLSLKQRLSDNLSFFFNMNNFTSVVEDVKRVNQRDNWDALSTSQRYGLSADFGVRIEL